LSLVSEGEFYFLCGPIERLKVADVAKLVDALLSGGSAFGVKVRILSSAQKSLSVYTGGFFYFLPFITGLI
jgi:hypothetical protein